jgi:hypothetical protein
MIWISSRFKEARRFLFKPSASLLESCMWRSPDSWLTKEEAWNSGVLVTANTPESE